MTTNAPAPAWELVAPHEKNFPFRQGEEQKATVIPWRSVPCVTWVPDPDDSHRTPCWVYVSTERMGFVCTMSVAPGDFFEIGNHPNVETYYMLSGVLHLSNPDTGQVVELRPDDAAIIPALEYHVGYNFSTEKAYVLCSVPGECLTPEMHADPVWAHNYHRREVTIYGDTVENDGFASKLRELRQWPPSNGAITRRDGDNRRVHRGEWIQFVTGNRPRTAILSSFYYSTPQLAAGSVIIPPNRVSAAIRNTGETIIYVKERCLVVNILETGQGLYAEERDAVFVPPGLTIQYQNTTSSTVEAMTFTTPWEGAAWLE
jgi:mannose-6-phosphate isomerase-like protein (cupin superfamily)